MKRPKVFVVGFLLTVCCANVLGRIGETLEECKTRYGDALIGPVALPDLEQFADTISLNKELGASLYCVNNGHIPALLFVVDDRVQVMMYEIPLISPNRMDYQIPRDEISELLARNYSANWIEGRSNLKHRKFSLRTWYWATEDDALTAFYDPSDQLLIITSPEFDERRQLLEDELENGRMNARRQAEEQHRSTRVQEQLDGL